MSLTVATMEEYARRQRAGRYHAAPSALQTSARSAQSPDGGTPMTPYDLSIFQRGYQAGKADRAAVPAPFANDTSPVGYESPPDESLVGADSFALPATCLGAQRATSVPWTTNGEGNIYSHGDSRSSSVREGSVHSDYQSTWPQQQAIPYHHPRSQNLGRDTFNVPSFQSHSSIEDEEQSPGSNGHVFAPLYAAGQRIHSHDASCSPPSSYASSERMHYSSPNDSAHMLAPSSDVSSPWSTFEYTPFQTDLTNRGTRASLPTTPGAVAQSYPQPLDASIGPGNLLPVPVQQRQAQYQTQGPKRPSTALVKASPDTPPSFHAGQNSSTKLQMVFRASGQKRARFDEESRRKTARTRQIGACKICKLKKLRCDVNEDPFTPCTRCVSVAWHLLPEPCCRIDLTDIKLFRLGSTLTPNFLHNWTVSKEARKGILLLEDGRSAYEAPRPVSLTLDKTIHSFPVTLSRFEPGPEDALGFSWTDQDGTEHSFEMPPYYISDMDAAKESIVEFFGEARDGFPRVLLADANEIAKRTFKEAQRFCDETNNALVNSALNIWSATRMIERTWLICGDDLLGIAPMTQNIGPCRWNQFIPGGAVPTTPWMDTQLDELTIRALLEPFRNQFLKLLQDRVRAKKKEFWYEIFLASFVVLNSAEHVFKHVDDFAKRFGLTSRLSSNSGDSLSQAYMYACKTILTNYHFAAGGATPFSLDWRVEAKQFPGMTNKQIQYMRDMQAEIFEQGERLRALKDESMYTTELFWCSQILFPGWRGDTPYRGEILDFTEKDFLFS